MAIPNGRRVEPRDGLMVLFVMVLCTASDMFANWLVAVELAASWSMSAPEAAGVGAAGSRALGSKVPSASRRIRWPASAATCNGAMLHRARGPRRGAQRLLCTAEQCLLGAGGRWSMLPLKGSN